MIELYLFGLRPFDLRPAFAPDIQRDWRETGRFCTRFRAKGSAKFQRRFGSSHVQRFNSYSDKLYY